MCGWRGGEKVPEASCSSCLEVQGVYFQWRRSCLLQLLRALEHVGRALRLVGLTRLSSDAAWLTLGGHLAAESLSSAHREGRDYMPAGPGAQPGHSNTGSHSPYAISRKLMEDEGLSLECIFPSSSSCRNSPRPETIGLNRFRI